MSSFIINTHDAYDAHGPIKYMTRSGGYVMVRRPRCAPFVLSEKDWRRLPKDAEGGASWRVNLGGAKRVEP